MALLPLIEYSAVFFFIKETAAAQYTHYYTASPYWYYLAFLTLMTANKGAFNFSVELCGVWVRQVYQLFFSLANFFTLSRQVFLTRVNTARSCYISSLSSLFFSVAWLEREVRELEGFYFRGLQDTRRLLQDYLVIPEKSLSYTQYVTLSYNHIVQNVLGVKLEFLF